MRSFTRSRMPERSGRITAIKAELRVTGRPRPSSGRPTAGPTESELPHASIACVTGSEAPSKRQFGTRPESRAWPRPSCPRRGSDVLEQRPTVRAASRPPRRDQYDRGHDSTRDKPTSARPFPVEPGQPPASRWVGLRPPARAAVWLVRCTIGQGASSWLRVKRGFNLRGCSGPATVSDGRCLVGLAAEHPAEFVSRRDPQLGEHLSEVICDGPSADEQPRADLGVGESVSGHAGDLDLLRGELIPRFDRALAPEFRRCGAHEHAENWS
jgi:hypothetical protein